MLPPQNESKTFLLQSAGTTNATLVRAGATRVGSIVVTNTNAAVRFLKLYNLAVAPTVGTSIPTLTISVPVSGVPLVIPMSDPGLLFPLGLALATTTVITDADATAVGAGDLKIAIEYSSVP